MTKSADFFSPFPVLITSRLVLRQISLDDVNEIFVLRSDKTILKYIDKAPAVSLQDGIDFINRVELQREEKTAIHWAIVLKGEARLCGMICIWKIDKLITQGEVGYSMLPHYYGKGIMNEALEAIIHFGFEVMNLKHLEAYTHKDNVASRNLLERNHFKRNQQLELEKCGKTEPVYTVIYSLANRSRKKTGTRQFGIL